MSDHEAFVAAMDLYRDESQGFARMYLVRQHDKSFAKGIIEGSATARHIAFVIQKHLREMGAEQTNAARMCVCCTHRFGKRSRAPGAFCVILPGAKTIEGHRTAMCAPVCVKCCETKDDDELMNRTVKMASKLFVDFEVVTEEN
jgi:hypothetical protein